MYHHFLWMFSARNSRVFGTLLLYLPQPEAEQQRPPYESFGLQIYALVPPQVLSGVKVRFCLPKWLWLKWLWEGKEGIADTEESKKSVRLKLYMVNGILKSMNVVVVVENECCLWSWRPASRLYSWKWADRTIIVPGVGKERMEQRRNWGFLEV